MGALRLHPEPEEVTRFVAEYAPKRLGELYRSCLDATRARKELGFTAATTSAEGIRARSPQRV